MPPRFANINPTPAAAPAPAVVEPSVETAPASNALSLFGGSDMTSALLAVVEEVENSVSIAPIFPTIVVSGGNTGGAFEAMKGTPDELRDQLPEGRKPIPLVLLGYRTHLFSWAENKSESGEKSKPIWFCNVPCSNTTDYQLITQVLNKFNYKKKPEKEKHAVSSGGPGIVKAQFQALVYLPAIDNIAVIQGLGLYGSWVGSCRSVAKLIDPAGGFQKTPVSAHVVTTDEKGAEPWKLHTLAFQLALPTTVTREGVSKQFVDFCKRMQGDQDVTGKVLDWLNATDRPINDDIRAKLKASLAI